MGAADKKEAVMVEIPAKVENTPAAPVTTEQAGEAGLSAQEIALGKASGVLTDETPAVDKKDDKKEEKVDDKVEEVVDDKKEEKTDDKKDAKPTPTEAAEDETLDPAKEHELVKTYSPNEKALYFKQKKERLKRQAAERERDFLKTQNEGLRRLAEKKETNPNADLEKDLENLDDPEKDKDKPLTAADLDKREEAKKEKDKQAREASRVINERLNLQNLEAQSKYDDFDAVCDLANEVMAKDPHGVYATKLVLLAADPEGNAAEYAYMIGKLHPNYGKHRKEVKKEEAPGAGATKKDIAKIVDNAGKRTSSAQLGGGSEKGRLVSEDDLKIEDVAGMPQAQWDALSSKTRDRLMRS